MKGSPGLVLLFLLGGAATAVGQDARAQAFWIENVEHSWEVLSGLVHAFGVEVKAARGATASR